jgi:hypothetical protein
MVSWVVKLTWSNHSCVKCKMDHFNINSHIIKNITLILMTRSTSWNSSSTIQQCNDYYLILVLWISLKSQWENSNSFVIMYQISNPNPIKVFFHDQTKSNGNRPFKNSSVFSRNYLYELRTSHPNVPLTECWV